MATLRFPEFLRTLPPLVLPHLPPALRGIQVHQPWQWIIQFHFGEPRLHYEVSRVAGQERLELGFHFEAKDTALNSYLLRGFDHHLVELHDLLGSAVTAEVWDKGWTKVYELYPASELTSEHQTAVAQKLGRFITCAHPIFVDLRREVAKAYR